ncbi:MAG: FAD-dependent oxidoreductase [Nitrospirae bacterium]|nr:FAD-dependent oxidoreductase [Nitrospirota bacterium]
MSAPAHVVGGGFAGAAAAVALARRGVPVVLWEARAAWGGRVASFTDARSGERLDNGPHLFLGCYARTRALLAELGTGHLLSFQPTLHLPRFDAGRAAALHCPELPAPWFLVGGLLGLPLTWADRLRLLAAGHAIRRPVAPGLSVASWLAAIGAPAASIPLLWGPLCRAIMNLEPAEADAGAFAAALREGLGGTAADACLGWSRVPLGDLLEAVLEDRLARAGGTVRHRRVARVVLDGDRVTGLATGDGETVPARRVILATGPAHLQRLLPAHPALQGVRQQVAALGAAPIVSVYLWFDRPVAPMGESPFVGLAGGRVEWLFDRDRMAGRTAGPGQRLAAVISAADAVADWDDARLVAATLDDMAVHLPAARGIRPAHSRVIRERRATVRLAPGVDRPRPGAVAGVDGLYLCGDYTDTGLPATIEGAVRSGEAAAAALATCGHLY